MDQLVQLLASKLGIEESVAKSAVTKVLEFLKDKLDDDVFTSLLGKLPGAEQLVAAAGDSGGAAEGGMLGGLAKMASSALGSNAGDGVQLAGQLSEAGLATDQVPAFLTQVVEFVKENVSEEMLQQLTDSIPALRQFMPS